MHMDSMRMRIPGGPPTKHDNRKQPQITQINADRKSAFICVNLRLLIVDNASDTLIESRY